MFRDQNHVPAIFGSSNADGTTPTLVYIDPTSHILQVDDDVTGSDFSGDTALRDENHVTGLLAVSDADGVTPVPVYVDAITNKLLINSN